VVSSRAAEEATFRAGYVTAQAALMFGVNGLYVVTPKESSSEDAYYENDGVKGATKVKFAGGFRLAGYGVLGRIFHFGLFFEHSEGSATHRVEQIGEDTFDEDEMPWTTGSFKLNSFGLAMKLGGSAGKHTFLGAAIDLGPAFFKSSDGNQDILAGANINLGFAIDLLPVNVPPMRMAMSVKLGLNTTLVGGKNSTDAEDTIFAVVFAPGLCLGGSFGA
jgi:hypothetical protein